jgi:nitrogenase molybdenum-iron protein beta chain
MAVVGDSATAVSITKFLANEIGYLAEVVIIVDDPSEEYRAEIAKELSENVKSVFKPVVIFEADSHRIKKELTGRNFLVLLASSLERYIAPELGAAIHLSVSFPSFDRLILERGYAVFHGGIALMEDIIGKRSGPL